MVYFLVGLHPCEKLRFDVRVSPAEVKIEEMGWVCLKEPLMFFGEMFDDSILGFWVCGGVPATLMTSLCFLGLWEFLYAVLRMLSGKVPSKESSSFCI